MTLLMWIIKQFVTLSCICMIMLFTKPSLSREYIHIVGSSALFPYIISASEFFGQITNHKTPLVEATGSGGGIKLFANGIGLQTPDIVISSRAMSAAEKSKCHENNVQFMEIAFGYDGIILATANTNNKIKLSIKQLYDLLVENKADNKHQYQKWSDIDPSFMNNKIRILGPPDTSGTKIALLEIMLHLHKDFTLRKDNIYIDAADQENVIVQKILADKDAFAVISYAFFKQNDNILKALAINAIKPSVTSIVSGQYPLSRKLYIYFKLNHMKQISGFKEFTQFFLNENIIGDYGLLAKYHFIPLPQKQREKIYQKTFKMLSAS